MDRLYASVRPSPAPRDIHIENIHLPGPHRKSLRVRLYRPQNLPPASPAMLWLHGGGYIIGTPEQDDQACIQF